MFRPMVLVGLAALIVSACGGSHKASHTSQGAAAATPRTLRFQLAAAHTGPVSVQVPSRPLATTNTNLDAVLLRIYVARRVSAQAVLVVFAVTDNGQNDVDEADLDSNLDSLIEKSGFNQPGESHSPTVSGVSLFDPAGLKQYLTYMVDPNQDGTCLCSTTQGGVPAGQTRYYAAYVAAPPATVSSVSFVSGLGIIAGVPLS